MPTYIEDHGYFMTTRFCTLTLYNLTGSVLGRQVKSDLFAVSNKQVNSCKFQYTNVS